MEKLVLCVMCKNEGKIIERMLESAKPMIDEVYVHDTGSSDDTKDLIRRWCINNNIPCEVRDIGWNDFGTNREYLVRYASDKYPGRYLLLGDGDYEFRFHKDSGLAPILPLTHEAYYLTFEGALQYENVKIVKGIPDRWKYVGKTHEYIQLKGGDINTVAGHIPKDVLSIYEHCDGGNRSTKYERDLELLNKSIKEDPKDARAQFYLARTYEDLSRPLEAYHQYIKRTQMEGWYEETYCAYLGATRTAIASGLPLPSILGAALSGMYADEMRRETILLLIRHLRDIGRSDTGYRLGVQYFNSRIPEGRILFVEREVYDWKLNDEIAMCAYTSGRGQIAKGLWEQTLANSKDIPASEEGRIKFNIRWIINEIQTSGETLAQ